MFGNLFGKKEKNRLKDRTWISGEAKKTAILKILSEDPKARFICWFTDTQTNLQEQCLQEGIESSHVLYYRTYHYNTAHNLYFAEHFPLRKKELELIETWLQESFFVFNALEEPLFKAFNSDKLIQLAKSLGMKETDMLEHDYISSAIHKAQQKLQEKITMEHSADSARRWMQLNMGTD